MKKSELKELIRESIISEVSEKIGYDEIKIVSPELFDFLKATTIGVNTKSIEYSESHKILTFTTGQWYFSKEVLKKMVEFDLFYSMQIDQYGDKTKLEFRLK